MSTTMSTPDFADFLTKWEGTPRQLDLSELLMLLDASETVLKQKFEPRAVTPQMITTFSGVVARQLFR